MKITSLVLLCLALICRLSAVEPVSTPAAQAAPTPAQLELAREVIKATQFDRMFDQMGAQMQKIAASQLNLSSPNLTPEQKEAAGKIMGEVMTISMDAAKKMLSKVDTIYAEVYSEAELKAMLAFFASPEGKSMLQKQPQIMQHMMPMVQEMQKEIGPKIQAIVLKARADAEEAEAAAAKAKADAAAKPEATAPAAPTNAPVKVAP
ncbi:MAG TPA: DUF2059 domain-containing protein [Lacunisphaera sp.]|jgi:hypothetical protein